MPAPEPINERERLAALRSCGVLDSEPEPVFDEIAKLASQLCATPMVLVSLVDARRQWFKARVGLAAPETPRDVAFGPVTTFDPVTQKFTAVAGIESCFRGIAADNDGSVWVAANGPCGVAQIDHKTNTLIKFHALNPCSTPVGVSVDTEGFVWVVDEYIGAWKIDPQNPQAMQLINIPNDHYTYSDMTGGQLKSVILPQ